MEAKGTCTLCGKKVYGHETRGKDQAGGYVHMDCVKAQESKALARARPAPGEDGGGGGGESESADGAARGRGQARGNSVCNMQRGGVFSNGMEWKDQRTVLPHL